MTLLKNNIYFLLIATIMLLLSSCDNNETDPQLEVPETYTFKDSEGNSTVNFDGQITRINQLSEIVTYMKTANTPGVSVNEDQLLEMYSNNNGNGSTFFSSDANDPGKQLKNKTANGSAVYTEKFENLFEALATISSSTVTGEYNASNGNSGVLKSGEKSYLVNAKGNEYGQLIEKGLMGAVFYDQIQNGYLGSEKMNVDNTEAVDPENGKYFTTMEHHWDEAFGYFTSAIDFPTNGTDRFWGKYSHVVNDMLGSDDKLMTAFTTGRAAIRVNDLTTRDAQIVVIRKELEKVSAACAIHYLNGAMGNFGDDALRSHELSEAVAFIEALYFTAQETAEISGSEIGEVLDFLKDSESEYNFYEVTISDITNTRDALAGYIGMDSIKDQL